MAVTSLFLVTLLVADAGYVAFRLRSSLLEAASLFEEAGRQLDAGDISAARSTLREALVSSERGVDLIRHPSAAIGARIPKFGPDVRAIAAIARASHLAAMGSLEAADAASELGATGPEVADAIYQDGALRLDLIRAAQPFAERADEMMSGAIASLLGSVRPNSKFVEGLLQDAIEQLTPVAKTVHTGHVLSEALPDAFGAAGTRTYLLGFQALGEARGTGGLIGLVGLLRFKDGVPRLSSVKRVLDVFDVALTPVKAPDWFASSYGPQGALAQPQQANASPSFPAAAGVFMRMYEQATNVRLNGMIALDARALALMLDATGPIRVRGFGGEVNSANAADILLHDSYSAFPGEAAQNRFFARVIEEFWKAARSEETDASELARQIGEAVRTQHCKIFFRNDAGQASMSELGATGDYALHGPNTQVIFGNNYALNKIDYYMHRKLATVVRLREDGSAKVTTSVELDNQAPSGPPSLMIGPGLPGDSAGLNRTLLSFLLPEGAVDARLDIGGATSHLFRSIDQQAPVVWQVFEIEAGGQLEARLTYDLPRAFLVDGERRFRFTLGPQTTAQTDTYSLKVLAPRGGTMSSDTGADTSRIELSGLLEAPIGVNVTVS